VTSDKLGGPFDCAQGKQQKAFGTDLAAFWGMPNPQLDQFMNALIWKAVPPIILCSVGALLLREFLRWLERKATRAGRSRRAKRGADPSSRIRSASSSGPAPYRPLVQEASPALALTLEDVGWENFELLSGEIFRRQGFEVEISSGLGADGGKDLTLRRDGEVRLVQCKRLSAKNWVSVMEMREFYGLLMAENAKSGIFMTTGFYSQDAKEFAKGKPIELLGRADIERLMLSVARSGENLCIVRDWIDDFVAGANVADPICPRPRCRMPMELRRGAAGGMFWRCTRCHGKRDARTELVRAYAYQQS